MCFSLDLCVFVSLFSIDFVCFVFAFFLLSFCFRALLLEAFENYKDARNYARDQRQNADSDSQDTFKVMFAETPLDAEEKLSEFREKPIVKEWEK